MSRQTCKSSCMWKKWVGKEYTCMEMEDIY